MKETLRKKTLWLIWLLFPFPTYGGETAEQSWANLGQLRAGQKTKVMLTSLKSVEGTWVDFSNETITLKVGDQLRAIERPSVARVRLNENPRRLRSTLLGLAIGGGAGLAVSAAFGSKSEGALRRIAPVCAAAGAGLGAAFPSYQTIYRAKLPEPVTNDRRSPRDRAH
jgi:hypothetical protein